MSDNRKASTGFARHLRRSAPANERKLWEVLRDRQLEGLKFRRQVPVGPYVADFLCHRHRLIVEADGPTHDDSAHDQKRDAWLRAQGYRVLRFPNAVIARDHQEVLTAILSAVNAGPSPLAGEGGGEADG